MSALRGPHAARRASSRARRSGVCPRVPRLPGARASSRSASRPSGARRPMLAPRALHEPRGGRPRLSVCGLPGRRILPPPRPQGAPAPGRTRSVPGREQPCRPSGARTQPDARPRAHSTEASALACHGPSGPARAAAQASWPSGARRPMLAPLAPGLGSVASRSRVSRPAPAACSALAPRPGGCALWIRPLCVSAPDFRLAAFRSRSHFASAQVPAWLRLDRALFAIVSTIAPPFRRPAVLPLSVPPFVPA